MPFKNTPEEFIDEEEEWLRMTPAQRLIESGRCGQARWGLLECRAVETLISLASEFTQKADRLAKQRPLLRCARAGDEVSLTTALAEEERLERTRDREYWRPLRAELERMRLGRQRR
jgi:hypothetical protein